MKIDWSEKLEAANIIVQQRIGKRENIVLWNCEARSSLRQVWSWMRHNVERRCIDGRSRPSNPADLDSDIVCSSWLLTPALQWWKTNAFFKSSTSLLTDCGEAQNLNACSPYNSGLTLSLVTAGKKDLFARRRVASCAPASVWSRWSHLSASPTVFLQPHKHNWMAVFVPVEQRS